MFWIWPMPKPSPISLVPSAIRPLPINLPRPPLLLEAAIAASSTRNRVDQCLNFIGWPFIAKEAKNDTDGFFSHNIIDAGLYGQPSNQFVHIALNRLLTGSLPKNILTFHDANYKR
jgi:hypothetical protein